MSQQPTKVSRDLDSDPHRGPWFPQQRRAIIVLGLVVVALLPLVPMAAAPASGVTRWLSTRLGLAQVIAFPRALGLVVAVVAVALGSLALLRRRRSWQIPTAVATLCALLACLLLVAPPQGPWASDPLGAASNAGRQFTVVTWNSRGTMTAADFGVIVQRWDPDIVILPEAPFRSVTDAIAGTPFEGSLVQPLDDGFGDGFTGEIAPTSVVVHERVGSTAPVSAPATSFGTVALDPTDTALPTIVGVHAAPPLPGLMQSWRTDVSNLVAWGDTDETRNLVIAGDFNATLRHGALAGRSSLVDSAESCGDVDGTWPAGAPSLLRTPIDHVLVSPDIEVLSCATARIGSADHLAYATTLRLPA